MNGLLRRNQRRVFESGGFHPEVARLRIFQQCMDAMNAASHARTLITNASASRVPENVGSFAIGIYAFGWSHQVVAGFGSTLFARTASLSVFLASCLIARFVWQRLARQADGRRTSRFLTIALIAAHALCAATVLVSAATASAGWTVVESAARLLNPSGAASQTVLMLFGIAAAWLIPWSAAVFGALFSSRCDDSTPRSISAAGRIAMVVLGLVFAESISAWTGGVHALLLVAAAVSCCVFVLLLIRPQQADQRSTDPQISSTDQSRQQRHWTTLIQAAMCGVVFVAIGRVVSQFSMNASWSGTARMSALLLGAGFCLRFVRGERIRAALPCFTGIWLICLTACFSLFERLSLHFNSETSSVALSALGASLPIVLAYFPIGAAASTLVAGDGSDRTNVREMVVCVVAAVLTDWWLLRELGPPLLLLCAAVLFVIVAAFRLVILGQRRRLLRPAFIIPALALGVSVPAIREYRPQHSARTLFDTGVFLAHRVEERSDILCHLDEGRCLTTIEGDAGTVTMWKFRGNEVHSRITGIRSGKISADTETCPQPSEESLQAILPLVLHEHPQRVLLAGLRAGAVLHTCMRFPLTSIDCVESDRGVIDALRECVAPVLDANPFDDGRVTLNWGDPSLTIHTLDTDYDVIIFGASQPASLQGVSLSTVESLQAASRGLAEDGMFCQPLDFADLGPQSLGLIINTWQTAFADVSAFRIAPGTLLLIGTNSPQRAIHDGFVERLQRSHVRSVLSESGFDWTTPLQLIVYTSRQLNAAFGKDDRVHRIENALIACTLPREVLRWGEKYSATVRRLAAHGVTAHSIAGPDAQTPELLTRLDEVNRQRTLVHDYPDKYWAYRKAVKDRIRKTPRSELIQVKGEEPLHELHSDDQRRLDYFKALGRAAKSEAPTADSLAEVADYAAPYDPLITPFLHEEVAELASRAAGRHAAVELQHRLQRVYFTSAADTAVRNVITAIHLVCDHESLIPEAASRADQLDALLQVLHNRWHNRGDISPESSQIVMNDIELSIDAAESALQLLKTLTPDRGFSSEQFDARRLALQKSLVGPLRTYRSMLLARRTRGRRIASGASQ